MTLIERQKDHQNNFNLIRMIAALMVLISHSYPLSNPNSIDPLLQFTGISLGELSVDAFFVISGFLVTGSLESRASIIQFLKARCLRVYPALITMLIITTLFMGAIFTSNSLIDYYSSKETWRYLIQNSIAFHGFKYELPGVFIDNPYKKAVNGSLWTLANEINLYFKLAIIWWLCSKFNPNKIFRRTLLFIFITLLISHLLNSYFEFYKGQNIRLSYFFCSGSVMWLYRGRGDDSLGKVNIIFVMLCLLGIGLLGGKLFYMTYLLVMPFLVFKFAYLKNKLILRYNKLGDYSYGVYIYAFPIQQVIAHVIKNAEPLTMAIISIIMVVPISILSWNLIEKQALKFK